MTRKQKTKKKQTLKMYRGGDATRKPDEKELEKYNIVGDNYKKLIEKLDKNLNLNDKNLQEGEIGPTPYKGCFNYLRGIAENLKIRPKIIQLNKTNPKIQGTLDVSIIKVEQLKKDYVSLFNSLEQKETDTEIVFHIILGCIQSLQTVIEEIFTIIKSTKADFKEYTKYFNFKIPRIDEQLNQLKGVDSLTSKMINTNKVVMSIVPLKVENNIALYDLWKEHKDVGSSNLSTLNIVIDPVFNKK
jgi:hypothetical protein